MLLIQYKILVYSRHEYKFCSTKQISTVELWYYWHNNNVASSMKPECVITGRVRSDDAF